MCGIAAIFNYTQHASPVQSDELLKIREAMIVRGPDDSGLWVSPEQRVGLAHRRLAILDLSKAGRQPMSSEDGKVRIVFNGEIYNYRSLRATLKTQGYRFRSTSDTEVLLYLYQQKGMAMTHELRGMYAFALWDDSKQGLFLARDPFGIKPLYYADDGATLRVASQVRALIQGGRINTSPEPAGHVGFFLWGYIPEPYTLYKDIKAFPPGTSLWADNLGRKQFRTFCDIKQELSLPIQWPSRLSPEKKSPQLREALLDSIQHHLISDVPVGVFLSSGLDSTTLVALASEIATENLRTITLGFKEYKGTEHDETPLAETVARQYGTRHETRWICKQDFLDELEHILQVMDQPSIDGVNTYFVSKVTVEAGLKVALSGLGGDELLGGYPSFRQLPKLVNVLKGMKYVPWFGKTFRWVSAPLLRNLTSPKYASIFEYGHSYGGAYLLRRGLFMPWELPEFLEPEIVKEGWQALNVLTHLNQAVAPPLSSHFKVSILESCWYMRNQLLRDTDWAGMSHSLEIRIPLVDLELWRRLISLFTLGSPLCKQNMIHTLSRSLPSELLNRRKTGFSVPLRKWLIEDDKSMVKKRGLRGWAHKVYKSMVMG